jgi:hypothetical protein
MNKRPLRSLDVLGVSVALALFSGGAYADTWGNTKNAFGKAVDCVKDSAKAGLITADAASKILGIMSDPQGAACVAQVAMPDVITIGVSAAMVIANTQGKLHQGMCKQELQSIAFEPFVDGISTFTGLSLDKDPLAPLVKEGKDKAWDYLSVTPPSSLVLSKVNCGCIFIDNGVSYETAAKIAKAYTAAGESCAGFAEAAAKVVCEASNDTKAACKLIGSAATALNNAGESLFQDSAVPWEEYYDTWWKYFESSYIEQSIAKGSPIDTGTKMKAKNGHAQVDPMAYNNKTIAEARADSEKYFDNHKNSNASAKERGAWLEQRFRANGQPFVDAGIKYGKFANAAKAHVAKRIGQWESEVSGSGYYVTQMKKLIEMPKAGTVELDNGVVPGGGNKVWLRIFLPSGSLQLPGYAGKGYRMWMQSTGGDEAQMNAVLDLAYNEASEKLGELLAAYKKEVKDAKDKDFTIPVRIMVADGAVAKLGKISTEGICAGMNESIAPHCNYGAKQMAEAAEAERKSRLRYSYVDGPGVGYGQSKNGKYEYFDPIYKYEPHIKVRDDWVAAGKYDAVLTQAEERVASYNEKIKNIGDSFKNINLRHNILTEQWTWQCGAAIGKPDSKPTPMCEGMVASAVASCLTKGPVLELAMSGKPFEASLVGTNAAATAGALAKGTGSSSSQSAKGPSSQSSKGSSKTADYGKAGSSASAAGLNKGGGAPYGIGMTPSECGSEVQQALQQYADRHAVNPANDKPYPPTSASIQDAKATAKNPALVKALLVDVKGDMFKPRKSGDDGDVKLKGDLKKIKDVIDGKDDGKVQKLPRKEGDGRSAATDPAPVTITNPALIKGGVGGTPERGVSVEPRGTAGSTVMLPPNAAAIGTSSTSPVGVTPRSTPEGRGTATPPPPVPAAAPTVAARLSPGIAPAPQVPPSATAIAVAPTTPARGTGASAPIGATPPIVTAPPPASTTTPAPAPQPRSVPPIAPPAPPVLPPVAAPTPPLRTAAGNVEDELNKAGCKPVTGQRGSYSCATKQALDVCEGFKKQNKVSNCVQGR